MKNDKMIWSILVHLSMHMWGYNPQKTDPLPLDEETWDYILDESHKMGINMIVLDVGDAIQYASHPEISMNEAWTRKRVRQELKRCRELGIELVPKLNFSTIHGLWLGEYARMVSTTAYYKVANDLIHEVYELFDHPRFIHLGMDEEAAKFCGKTPLAVFRQGELYWHDLRFLYDCVHDTGAMPWVWSNPLFEHPEEYAERFDPKEAVLSPYHYNAFRKEHWTPIESRAEYVTYYNEGEYAKLGIKFVEEDPYLVEFIKLAIPLMEKGYLYVPCASVFNRCDWNHSDLVEYFRDNGPADQILGYMTAPWFSTEEKNRKYFEETFKFYKEAKEKFYPNN